MKLMIASDIHGSAPYCAQMLRAYEREGAERLLLLGDILYHGPRNDLPEGYAPREVDEFLDKVIADYQTYDETIRELGESLQSYEHQVEQLKAKIAELEAKVGAEGETMPPQSQVDILKRLSRLEYEVFKK